MNSIRLFFLSFCLIVLSLVNFFHASSLSAANGLDLSFSAGGDLDGFEINGKNLLTDGKSGGFYVKDMGAIPLSNFANGSFESETGWSFGDNWYRDRKEFHNGKWSAKLEMPDFPTNIMGKLLSDKISIESDKEYLFTFWVKAKKIKGDGVNLLINQYDKDDNLLKKPVHFIIKEQNLEKDWYEIYYSFKTNSAASSITISIYAYKTTGIIWIDDVKISKPGSNDFVKFTGNIISSDNQSLVYKGSIGEKNLAVNATFSKSKDYIKIDGTIEDLSGKDRALILSFRMPVDANNWIWWDDIHRKREINKEECYHNYFTILNDRFFSTYPLSCISSQNASLSFALPINKPRIFRISYCYDKGYELEFDFGLSRDTSKFPNKASFSFLIYSSDPKWGMRSALKKYYDIFPYFFEKRNEREGIWYGHIDTENIKDPEDFGLMFDETPRTSLIYDNRHKIYAFQYLEPYGINIPWPGISEKDLGFPAEISYSKIKKRLEDMANNKEVKFPWPPGPELNLGKAALNSAYQDENGRFYIARHNYLYANPDPDIEGESYGKFIIQALNYFLAKPQDFYSTQKYLEKLFLDGCYIDSIVPWNWSNKENYRKEQFRYADIPLVFSYKTRKPIQLSIFSNYELISEISDLMHKSGKLMLGNTWAPSHTFFAHLFDILGAGEYSSDQPDFHFHYLRALSYKKTLSFTDRELTNPDLDIKEKEKRFKKCLAYGVFPGTYPWKKPAWEHTKDVELPRELYKKYIPSIRTIAKTGWEPVTEATSSHPDVLIERFGPTKQKDIYFTLRNISKSQKKITLRINALSLGFSEAEIKSLVAEELIDKKELRTEPLKNSFLVQVEIAPEDTKLLYIGFKKRNLIRKLEEIKTELNIFSNSEISTYKTENLFTNRIAPEKNSESIIYFYDKKDGLADSRIVQMKNNSNEQIVQIRIPEVPVKPGEFYFFSLTYKASLQETTRKGFLRHIHSAIYNLSKFLSGGYLPDIAVRLLFLDHKNNILNKDMIYFNEFTYTDSWKHLDKYFISPSDSKSMVIYIKLESNRSVLLLKDLRLYSRNNAIEAEREINHVGEIKSFIKENLISNDGNLINLINELLIVLENDNFNEADLGKKLAFFKEQLIQFEKKFIFMAADESLKNNNDILRFLWRLKIIDSIKTN